MECKKENEEEENMLLSDEEKVLAAIEEGIPLRLIPEKTGVTYYRMKQILEKNGIKTMKGSYPKALQKYRGKALRYVKNREVVI